MAINCQVIKDNQGNIINVEAPNGNTSILYSELKNITNNQDVALNLWSYSYTDDFNEVEDYQKRDYNGEHLVSTVLNNITTTKVLESNSNLSKEDVAEIQKTKALTLPDVLSLPNISNDIKDRIKVHLAQNKPKEDIEQVLSIKETPTQPFKELVGIKDRTIFDKKVQSLSDPNFIDKYNSNIDFADTEFEKHSSLQKIEVFSEIDGELVQEFENDTYQDLINSLKPRQSNISIASNIEFLNGIEEEVWYESAKEISEVLKDIQTKTINLGIDTTSLLNDYETKTKTEIINYLNSVSSLTSLLYFNTFTDQDIRDFAEIHNQYNNIITTPKEQIILETEYSVAQINTSLSEKEMFDKFGYIKVENNLYQKVDKTEDYLENLYELSINENNPLPQEAFYPTAFTAQNEFKVERVSKPENKEAIKENIKRYLSSQIKEETSLDIVAYKIAFGHLNNRDETPKVNPKIIEFIKEDISYLTGEFLSDLKVETLKEKLKDSVFYNKVLKHLEIGNKGITLKPTANLKEIEFYTPKNHKLIQYSYISKDSQINNIFAPKVISDLSETTPKILRNLYINNPTLIEKYKGEYVTTDDNKVKVHNKVDNFIRINSTVLEKVGEKDGAAYYQPILGQYNEMFTLKDETLSSPGYYNPKETTITKDNLIKEYTPISKSEINEISEDIDNC